MNSKMLDKLVPPNDPEKVTTWRWLIVIVVTMLCLNGFAGRGILYDGMGAYASETALTKQGEKIDRVLVLQTASTLRDLKREECVANGSKAAIQAAIEEIQQDYIKLTGTRYPLLCKTEL